MLTFYKPNRSNKGCLASFKLVSRQSRDTEPFKEGCVFLKLVRQTSWNEETKKGSFKNGDIINVKFNIFELGRWVWAIEKNQKFDTFHSTKDRVGITFAPSFDREGKEQVGFGLYITRDREGVKEQFRIGFQNGEDVTLREFFKLAIEHLLMSNYAEEKRRYKASLGKTEPVGVNDEEYTNNSDEEDEDDGKPLFGN